MVPHIGWRADRHVAAQGVLHRALVAWSDTRESARALRDALPLLARAAQVDLVSFAGAAQGEAQGHNSPIQAAADHLSLHGVPATTTVLSLRTPTMAEQVGWGWMPDVTVAQALLSHATDIDADFIVMGGYGHWRGWELALGGVTRAILETMTVPVLMSH